jgi:type II secretory pathway pseudopilin PulG
MVVIGIIATLIALLLPALNNAREAAKRATASAEMAQIGSAVQAFKTDRRVTFLPSTITLRERMDYPAGDMNLVFLKQVWPQLPTSLTPPSSPFPPGTTPGVNGIDWNGDGVIDPDNTPRALEGDQCVVFFLGGIPRPLGGGAFGTNGFGSNPQNPADTSGAARTFFEFPSDRLMDVHNGSGFPSFIDPWKEVPYAYFAAVNGTKNAYSPGDCSTIIAAANARLASPPAWNGPYQDQAATAARPSFFQPTGWQIITAGKDKAFGRGGRLTKGGLTQNDPDGDNMVNFIGGTLLSY